jgi:hypothetical protein
VKLEGDKDVSIGLQCVAEFLNAENIEPIGIHRCLTGVYGDIPVDVGRVRRWLRRVCYGGTSFKDM